MIKPPRSPQKATPCGMTAALAAEARFAGRQRRRGGVPAPAGAKRSPAGRGLETLVKINKEKRLCFSLQCGKLFALKIQLYLFYGQKGMLV